MFDTKNILITASTQSTAIDLENLCMYRKKKKGSLCFSGILF